jgi:hypothetical protein
MILVPGDRSQQSKNVPSGTCLDEQCGLFSALSLDDQKMDEMQTTLEKNKQEATTTKGCQLELFESPVGTNAFVLVAHG